MNTSPLVSALVGVVTSVIVGLVLLMIEYRTRWFARWSQKRISNSHPDAEELHGQEVYIKRCTELINTARKQIVIRTSKMSKSESLPEAAAVNLAIQNAGRRNVGVRILVAASYDRLPGAIELTDVHKADVRFDPEIPMSDVNYYCADGSHLIVATRQPSQESQYQRSTSWIEFRSTFLASVLINEFEGRWKGINTRRLEQYLSEVLPTAIKQQGIHSVANVLGREPNAIEKYTHLKPFILFLVGRPGSGKTTIAQLIKQNLPLTGVYLRACYLSDLEYLGKVFAGRTESNKRFEQTTDGGFFILDSNLYDEALADLAAQVLRERTNNDLLIVEFARQSYIHALELMSTKAIEPDLVVYINVRFEVALERNRHRSIRLSGDSHFVSEREMRETYAKDDISELVNRAQPTAILIDNNMDVFTELGEKVSLIIETIKAST